MKLSAAASRFDRTVCTDAYDLAGISFMGQLDVFDDSKKDSLGASRRVLSAAPGTDLPPRKAITFEGNVWLVSAPNIDHFNGSQIRNKFSIQHCDGLANIRSAEQIISAQPGLEAYAGRTLIKTGKMEDSAHLINRFDFFFAEGEQVLEQQFITLRGLHYIVRSVAVMPTEFVKVTADQLSVPALVPASYAHRTYAPLTDSYTLTTSTCNLLLVDWQLIYDRLSQASLKYEDGDNFGLVRKLDVSQAGAGDAVTLESVLWRIVSVTEEGACWGLHLRRA